MTSRGLNEADMDTIAEKILNKESTIEELTADMKYYPYYNEAYHAVLGGFVGEYQLPGADNEKQYKACLKYVKRFDEMLKESQGLLFYGEVGTGKSFAAGCIANALLENTQSVIMTSFVEIVQSLSSNFGNKRDDESALMRDLMQPELLILDDLGAERSTDYAVEKVFNIIDSRCRERKPMILTTNLTLSDMKQCTDIRYARIYDRVFSACYPIKFEGVSRRKIEAKKRFEKMKKFFEGDD